jgi:lipopolysaccharide export system permease protein
MTCGKDANKGAVVVGILHRYVMGEVFRGFALALLTMTAVFVLFMVAAQARDIGLSPNDIVHLVPYVIPSTLPYTIPVSLLFSVTVVYGRLAGDNEIVAVKTAGLSVMTVLWPTLLFAALLSVSLFYLSGDWIPRCTHSAKMVLFKDMEDMFHKLLKRDLEFNKGDWPFLIKVRDVVDSKMIDATFLHKAKQPNEYDAVIEAKQAELHFDLEASVVRITLDHAEMQHFDQNSDVALINDNILEMPIPPNSHFNSDKKIQEYTNKEIIVELFANRLKLKMERRRQAIRVGLGFASGQIDRIDWGEVQQAFLQQSAWKSRCDELETEQQLRFSMALGSLLFVILGAPVGILFAKRDFLSAFMTCFMPIILLYYPLMLFGINTSKEGLMPPVVSLWIGNVLLAVLAGFALPPVMKH